MSDLTAIAEGLQRRASRADVARLGRLVMCRDSEADRAHLRLLVVLVQEDVDPGPPDELEWTARRAVASMRGTGLRRLPPGRG